jgi:hypothetical protein
MSLDLIPLADAIEALRAELVKARRKGEDAELRFEVGPVEVEFQVVYESEATAGGKVGFRIFGLGSEVSAGGKLADARTQSVKVTLTPRIDGSELEVGDEDDRPVRRKARH